MAASGQPLDNNEQFPSIKGSSVAHGEISVREHTAGSWSVLIFYRGDWWLTYPVVYGLNPEEMRRKIGCSISLEEPVRLEPTGIVLRPDGTIAWSAYASSAIGRLTADDTAAVMDFYQQKGF